MNKMDFETNVDTEARVCIIEPFYGGSHKQLIDLILVELDKANIKYDLYTMSAKKWHWRARCSALYFSQHIAKPTHGYRLIFASSVLNLAELISLRTDLASARKVVYFHENQLVYPVRKQSTRNKNQIENKEQRDFQYGYNQILTSLVADKVYFNSEYNRSTYLANVNSFLKQMPDFRPKLNVERELATKCSVLYFPIDLDQQLIDAITVKTTLDQMLDSLDYQTYLNRPIRILWSNRWEHDKNPEEFFDALFKLNEANVNFRLSVLGEQFTEVPEIFNEARSKLGSKIDHWGYASSKRDYYEAISRCDVVLSTSLHEFFGVSVLEACVFGAHPILPNRLVYPELYPPACLYSTEQQLVKKLKYICTRPFQFRKLKLSNSTVSSSRSDDQPPSHRQLGQHIDQYKWTHLKSQFVSIFHSPT